MSWSSSVLNALEALQERVGSLTEENEGLKRQLEENSTKFDLVSRKFGVQKHVNSNLADRLCETADFRQQFVQTYLQHQHLFPIQHSLDSANELLRIVFAELGSQRTQLKTIKDDCDRQVSAIQSDLDSERRKKCHAEKLLNSVIEMNTKLSALCSQHARQAQACENGLHNAPTSTWRKGQRKKKRRTIAVTSSSRIRSVPKRTCEVCNVKGKGRKVRKRIPKSKLSRVQPVIIPRANTTKHLKSQDNPFAQMNLSLPKIDQDGNIILIGDDTEHHGGASSSIQSILEESNKLQQQWGTYQKSKNL